MEKEEKLELCFKLLDVDKDGKLSTIDIMNSMKDLTDTDYISLEDLSKILNTINHKRNKVPASRNLFSSVNQAHSYNKRLRIDSYNSGSNCKFYYKNT